MKYALIAETPETLDIDAVDENGNFLAGDDVIQTLVNIGAVWPSSPAIASQTTAGRKIIYLIVVIPSTEPIMSLEAVIELYGLDWQLLAGQTFDAQLVGEGETATYEAVKIMEPNEARLFEFIPDRYLDEAQTTLAPKHVNQVTTYAGQAPWLEA